MKWERDIHAERAVEGGVYGRLEYPPTKIWPGCPIVMPDEIIVWPIFLKGKVVKEGLFNMSKETNA